MSKKLFYIIIVLFVVWGAMNMNYALSIFAMGNLGFSYYVVRFLRILLICFAFFHAFSPIKDKTNKYITLWALYAIIVTLMQRQEDIMNDISTILWWPAIYLLFFKAVSSNEKYTNIIITYIYPIIFIINSYYYLEIRAVNSIVETLSGVVGFRSSNEVFYIASLLPLAFLEKKKWLKYTYLTIGFILVIYSFKRSALLYTVLIYGLALYNDYFRNKRISITTKILSTIIILLAITKIFTYIDNRTDGHISNRIESSVEDGGSGRDEAYTLVLEKYSEQNILMQLFGAGFNGVIRDYKIAVSANADGHNISAHNDFLEMLADFGIVGFLIYLLIIRQLYRSIKKGKIIGENYYQASLSAFVVFIFMGMLSHLFLYPTYIAYIVMVFAIVNGEYKRLYLK